MELSPALEELIAGLRRELADMRCELDEARSEIATLRVENAELRAENSQLRTENSLLRSENAALKQEVADLRRQLGKNSSNSSKPPSSDGLKKKPRIPGSLRGKSDKKSGGQVGHKGDTLRQAATPDIVKQHHADCCAHCQATLTAAMVTGVEKRQVFDIPEPRLEVTEHQAQIYRCSGCHSVTKAAFPEGVNAHVQYGPRIRAAAIYFNAQQLIPEDRVGEVLRDVFAASLVCPASIVGWVTDKAAELAPFEAHIAGLVATAPVRNLDETGFRIAGKTQWLHTASTLGLTWYRVSDKRGAVPTNLQGGIIVHDHFKSYYTLAGIAHGLCNAHHLRELKALIEMEKEPWAKRLFRLLLKANKAVKRAMAQGAQCLAERVWRRIESLYDRIVARAIAFHEQQPPLTRKPGARGRAPRRVGHNLAIRLRDFKDDVIRFATDFKVPFTNNLAERDLRMMKVRMKISGCFRTMAGAQTFATLRSVLSTARKQGWNLITTLATPPPALINALAA